MKKYILFLALFILWLPHIAFAQAPGTPTNPVAPPTNPIGTPTNPGGSPIDDSNLLQNPLEGRAENIGELFALVINTLLALVGLIAIISITLAGYKMILGSGNSSEVEEAKSRIVWSLVGLAVVLLAYAIVRVTLNLLQ